MAQTNLTNHMQVADGTKLMIKLAADADYTDIGVVDGDTQVALEWDDFQEESANAGTLAKYIKNPKANGSFTLRELNYDNIQKMSSGLMEKVATAGSPTSDIPNQTIASGWTDNTQYELIAYTSSSDNTKLKLSAAPVLTTVTADPDGTPEVLAENTDYVIVENSEAISGYSIQFISANFDTASEGDEIEIVWGTNTPIERDTYHIGTITQELSSFEMKLEHTDTAGLVYGVNVYECYSNSGSLVFMFKSAAESGYNDMPFSFTGVCDISRANGRQLMSVYKDTGAI